MDNDDFSASVHALQRMFERGITETDIQDVLRSGKIVEEYPDDLPYPSALVLGCPGGRPVHVVVAANASGKEKLVVTVYGPDPAKWLPGFERRRDK